MIAHSKPTLGQEEAEAAARVVTSGYVAQGPEAEAFEAECAAFVKRKHAVAVSSGTNALVLALGALGVVEGSPVAIPSYVCAALATAIRVQRALPVLCDIGPDLNLNPRTVPGTAKTAIVPHLFGAPAELPGECTVIEDIAQSIGGQTGRVGTVSICSFYATKMLTTGEGGMVLTDDAGIAGYVRDHREYDKREDFELRFSFKMSDIEAAIGRVQLRRLPHFIERRSEIAAQYSDGFRGLPLLLPDPDGHVFYRYVISLDGRDLLERHLVKAGIDVKRPVFRPMHHFLGGQFPESERAHVSCLSLPIYPALTDDEVAHVIESVQRFFA